MIRLKNGDLSLRQELHHEHLSHSLKSVLRFVEKMAVSRYRLLDVLL